MPITTATLFDIGSTSTQFAPASIAMLVAEHKLAYTDDSRIYIPEMPDYDAPITIDNLLRHTSATPSPPEVVSFTSPAMPPATSRASTSTRAACVRFASTG